MGSRIEAMLETVRIHQLPRRRVCRVSPAATLGEVYRRLHDERSVAVLVEEDDRLLGIFTERDVLNQTVLEKDLDTPVGELMSRGVVTLPTDAGIADAIHLMTQKRIRHVPLVDDEGRTSGMVGGRDVLRMIAEYYPETLLNLPPRLDQKMTRLDGG